MTEDVILKLIGRTEPLFGEDLARLEDDLARRIRDARLLVIGGAGSIGGAVVKELVQRSPRALHVVDINENNLTEIVRDVRSSVGYIDGDFRTFCLDCHSDLFDTFIRAQDRYDVILNFSALKHVRSEKDPFTLMRMIDVNIFGTRRTLEAAIATGCPRYFCVSTDKASSPVNMMGASKRIMEMFLMRASGKIDVSSARFANVAFSDGSLPFAWLRRMEKRQPLAAPSNIRRYFVTDREGALLCLLAVFFGENRDLFFPKLSDKLHQITVAEMAGRFLAEMGYQAHPCASEDEARAKVEELAARKRWPCYFSESDTTGEKDFEEFYSEGDSVDWDRFVDAAVLRNDVSWDEADLDHFVRQIQLMRAAGQWSKPQLVELFSQTLDTFSHVERNRSLDERM